MELLWRNGFWQAEHDLWQKNWQKMNKNLVELALKPIFQAHAACPTNSVCLSKAKINVFLKKTFLEPPFFRFLAYCAEFSSSPLSKCKFEPFFSCVCDDAEGREIS